MRKDLISNRKKYDFMKAIHLLINVSAVENQHSELLKHTTYFAVWSFLTTICIQNSNCIADLFLQSEL